MRHISSTGLSIFGAAVIVVLAAFFTSAQAQYRGGYYGSHYYRGYYGYGPRYYGGYGYPHYGGYFAPGQLGPGWGPGYYEVTVFPTTYYDLPPYEEPGSYRSYVSYCFAYVC